jgi:hypothetical protein
LVRGSSRQRQFLRVRTRLHHRGEPCVPFRLTAGSASDGPMTMPGGIILRSSQLLRTRSPGVGDEDPLTVHQYSVAHRPLMRQCANALPHGPVTPPLPCTPCVCLSNWNLWRRAGEVLGKLKGRDGLNVAPAQGMVAWRQTWSKWTCKLASGRVRSRTCYAPVYS